MLRERGVEEEFDGLLIGHGGDGLEVGGVVEEALLDGADHEGADGEVFVDVVDDEAWDGGGGLGIGWGGGGGGIKDRGLVEGDGATGIEVGNDAPAEVDGAEDVGFEVDHTAGTGVDPEASFEAGEELGSYVGRRPGGIGFEVDDNERSAGCGLGRGLVWRLVGGLGLAWGVAPEHSGGHELEQLDAELSVVLVFVDVAVPGAGRSEQIVEAIAFRGVLLRSERAAIALDEAGDAALGGLDLVAHEVAFFGDFVEAIAQVGAGVLHDEDLVVGAVDGPGAWGRGEESRRRRLLRGG